MTRTTITLASGPDKRELIVTSRPVRLLSGGVLEFEVDDKACQYFSPSRWLSMEREEVQDGQS